MPIWNSCWQISTTFCTYALQVAWIKADTKAILAIHEHVITNNARLSVTHNDVNTWTLNLRGVKREDRGQYMCQVNTDPMKSQVSVWSAPVQSMFLTLVVEYLCILRMNVNYCYSEVSKSLSTRIVIFSLNYQYINWSKSGSKKLHNMHISRSLPIFRMNILLSKYCKYLPSYKVSHTTVV